MSKPFFQMILLFNGLLTMIACSLFSSASPATTPTAEPQVVATYWTAELVGELVEVEGCIRVNDRNSDTSYLLV